MAASGWPERLASSPTPNIRLKKSTIMNIGCFALNTLFSPIEAQLAQIAAWGFKYADVTDNCDGASLGVEFGFAAVASLDANPHDIRRQFAAHGIEIP